MRYTVEILAHKHPCQSGRLMMRELSAVLVRAGTRMVSTTSYHGASEWLVLFGIGARPHDEARRLHLKRGGHVLIWDLGYFGERKRALRMSIDSDHPQQWLDATPPDPARWKAHGLKLREDADAGGPIILVGLGQKSRAYLNAEHWEAEKLEQLRQRFPGRTIVYRPKGARDYPRLSGCEADVTSPIERLLKGASLVACRHSNVAVDAVIAGVPFEAQDGAAAWLTGRPYTPETRLDFLRRLAWWQWLPREAAVAWEFAQRIVR